MSRDEEIGSRAYLIRAACGRGERDPETLDDFAKRLKRERGADYNPVTISNLERGKRRWLVTDIDNFAAIDPKGRGRDWLAFAELPPLEAVAKSGPKRRAGGQ